MLSRLDVKAGRLMHCTPPSQEEESPRPGDVRNNDNKEHKPSHLSILKLKLGPSNKSLQ